jgi:hypothetical protein
VEDQPVVSVTAEGLRHDLVELGFHLLGRFSRGQAGTVADPKNMCVDGKGFLAEGSVEDYVRGLSADAGQLLELFSGPWNLTAIPIDQLFA